MQDQNNNDEELIAELEAIGQAIDSEIEIVNAMEQSFIEFKQEEFLPIYDEYYGSRKVGKFQFVYLDEKSASGNKLKNPKGGLTAAGRAYFKRKEGANLKPGVKGPANTPEKMRRKGSFLTRFFSNPSGPMKDEKGRATRLALSAAAWGEPVPGDAEAAARLAAKGRRLLEKYAKTKKKQDSVSEEIESKEVNEIFEKSLGQSIGQRAGVATGTDEAIDHDMDGMIFDGTPQEQRAPYKKQSNTAYEKARRKFVRDELARQGIKRNAKVQNRSKAERDARARARARFDQMTRAAGEEKQNEIDRAKKKTPATTNPKPADRYPSPSPKKKTPATTNPKPADRYPEPKRDNSWQRDFRNARKKPPLGPPAPKNKKPEQGSVVGPKFPGQDKLMNILKNSQR